MKETQTNELQLCKWYPALQWCTTRTILTTSPTPLHYLSSLLLLYGNISRHVFRRHDYDIFVLVLVLSCIPATLSSYCIFRTPNYHPTRHTQYPHTHTPTDTRPPRTYIQAPIPTHTFIHSSTNTLVPIPTVHTYFYPYPPPAPPHMHSNSHLPSHLPVSTTQHTHSCHSPTHTSIIPRTPPHTRYTWMSTENPTKVLMGWAIKYKRITTKNALPLLFPPR